MKEIFIFLNSIGIASKNIYFLWNYLNLNGEDFFLVDFSSEEFSRISNISKRSLDRIEKFKPKFEEIIRRVYGRCNALGIKITTFLDVDYPNSLKFIDDPPMVIYIRGNFRINNPIAFVGSRKHSAYGKYVVEKFINELSEFDMTIISGMAYGIDSIAHISALRNDLNTIAVLGSGVDVVYPRSNENLYRQIIENGAVISEFPLGANATKYSFPMRNRIISGLSKVVVIAEAKDKSGSLITARLGAEQGKEVLCAPGNINSIYSEGTNKLIRDGAQILVDIYDILQFFPALLKSEKKEESINYTKLQNEIISSIDMGINTTDLLMEKLKLDIRQLNSNLTMLELLGVVDKDEKLQYFIKR